MIHPAKVYLSAYTAIAARVDSLQEILSDLRSLATCAGVQPFHDRVQTSRKNDKTASTVVRIMEAENRIKAEIEHLAECLSMRLWLIEQMDDEREKLLLTLRYIQGMSFVQITMKMNYSESQVYAIHQDALNHFWEIHQKEAIK